MVLSYIDNDGTYVGYVEGAIYQSKTLVLFLVALKTETSEAGHGLLNGPYNDVTPPDGMASQLSQCIADHIRRNTPASGFCSDVWGELIQNGDRIQWVQLSGDDPKTFPT
jgi:hypothetical protein